MPKGQSAEQRLTVRLLPGSEVGVVAPLWRALEARFGDGWLTCGWDWTETWLDHYGDLAPHAFALAERAGEPRGVALVTQGVAQKRGPIPVRTLHVGAAGEPALDTVYVEYNRLLVAPEDRGAFARGLLDAARVWAPRWEEFVLDGFVPEDAAAFVQAEPGFFVRRQASPTTDLDAIRAGGGDVVAALGRNTRYQIRRSLRDFEPIATEWAETGDQASAILGELVTLHQRRWTAAGKPGVFASPRFLAFHRAIVARLLPRGAIVLFRARHERGTIGCLYGFIERGRVLSYQAGFAEYDEAVIKPGLVTHALCMQACLDRGLREYDYLVGEARYKRQLATGERELVWAYAARPGLKQRVLDYARRRTFGESQARPPGTEHGETGPA